MIRHACTMLHIRQFVRIKLSSYCREERVERGQFTGRIAASFARIGNRTGGYIPRALRYDLPGGSADY
jgi:hypothetical protein